MLQEKVTKLLEELPQIETELGDPAVVNDQKRYREITQRHAYLTSLKNVSHDLSNAEKQLEDNRSLLQEEHDESFTEMLELDTEELEKKVEKLHQELEELLIPPDPDDSANTIMEIRAGTGGDEAALFVADCVRMYKMFADERGWRYELLSCTEADLGGYKEYVMVLAGENVHRFLQYEGGTHRVQRVPETESQGRVHTSAVTVAVLKEPGEDVDIEIDEKDLRIDTYRASGAGGQHVNTTDSAVRMTHIPTGAVAYCQQERSQHKNREKAMRLLKAKIVEEEQRKKEAAVASTRASQVGSGDRSERIRTYNFPQNRLTDHRIGYTKHNLGDVMNGDVGEVTGKLVAHYYHEKLHS